jgi:hypothetical protein
MFESVWFVRKSEKYMAIVIKHYVNKRTTTTKNIVVLTKRLSTKINYIIY